MRNILILSMAAWLATGCSNESNNVTFDPAPSPAPSAVAAVQADTIFEGGPILTVNPVGEAQAIAVKDGKILAVGDRTTVLATRGPITQVVPLNGRTLMPGFVEPHMHINTTAQALTSLNLQSQAPNLPFTSVVSQLTAAAPQVPPGGWLYATGFDPSRTSPLFSTLNVTNLDAISTTVPIFVLNASEHIAYVNSLAFQLAGVTNNTPNPPGGTFVKDANGNLTGELDEPPAFSPFFAKFPPAAPGATQATWQQTYQNVSSQGVTTVGDLNTGIALGLTNEINLFTTLSQQPNCPIRVFCYLAFLAMSPQQQQGLAALPVQVNQGNDMLRFIGVKFTLDGSTQGFTAALTQPYLTNTTSFGKLDYPSTEALYNDVITFIRQGWQISMHCNGDRALDQGLAVHARVQQELPAQATRRHRIEHLTVQTEPQLDVLKQLNLTPSLLIGHTFYWGQVLFQNILGPERASRIDPTGSLKARNIRFSLHSDSTTTTVEPLRYIQNAVTRIPQLNPPAVLGPDQRISVDDAIRAVTLDAAYQLFMDDKIGSLEVGKYADFVILNQNPRTVEPTQIRGITVLETYLAGVKKF